MHELSPAMLPWLDIGRHDPATRRRLPDPHGRLPRSSRYNPNPGSFSQNRISPNRKVEGCVSLRYPRVEGKASISGEAVGDASFVARPPDGVHAAIRQEIDMKRLFSRSKRSSRPFPCNRPSTSARSSRSTHQRHSSRRNRGSRLCQETLEKRLALSVTISGYENAVDFYANAGRELDDEGFYVAPHSPQNFVHGRAIIASDDGDDVFIRQVASLTQDLQVDDNASFLDYEIIDNIDGNYQQIFVTNGTRRVETQPIRPDFDPTAFSPEGTGYRTRFMLTREELRESSPLDTIEGGSFQYVQDDFTVSTWTFGPDGGTGFPPLLTGPGVSLPLPAGHIFPTGIVLSANPNTRGNVGQSAVDITWSDIPTPGNRLVIASITYFHSDSSNVIVRDTDFNLFPNEALAQTTLNFTLPQAQATTQDGVTLRESLGVIPGTFRGERGAISVRWSDGVTYDLPGFRADVNGVLRFNQFVAPQNYTGSRYKDSYAFFEPPGMGVVAVRGEVTTAGVVQLFFQKYEVVDGVNFTDETGARWAGFGFDDQASLAGVPGPVTISNVEYLTYTRDAEPNTATFFAGQTITREVTVDLLAPGSTLNIESPINVDPNNTSFYQSTVSELVQLPDVDFRATNVNIRADVTTPDRVSIGHSQIARDRLSIPFDDVNPYLLSPSLPTLYERNLRPQTETPILPNGGSPELRRFTAVDPNASASDALVFGQAVAIAEVSQGGAIFELTLLPGFEGSGYDPDNPPVVTIAPPSGVGTPATAAAIVSPIGRISGFQILNPGAGYGGSGTRPLVTIDPPLPRKRATARVAVINAAAGTVTAIDPLDNGYRYHAPPRVEVAPPDSGVGGRQATARAILDTAGRIAAIEVVDGGSGYSERPVVTIADPSPLAHTENLLVRARMEAQVYEMYVADDFGTDTPRGLASINANGTISTTPTTFNIIGFIPPLPTDPVDTPQQWNFDPAALPANFNPTGAVISGVGVREGTRIIRWDDVNNIMTVPAGSISTTLSVPREIEISTRAISLYLEATTADVVVEGLVNVEKQSYLFNSAAADEGLAPFLFTTASPVTGTQTGALEGKVVDITLGNVSDTPLNGATVSSEASLSTVIDSLRVRAASSSRNPQGPFPYRLSVEDRNPNGFSLDALAASSDVISISTTSNMKLTGVVETAGDLNLLARSETDAQGFREPQTLSLDAPVSTAYGRISLEADRIEIRNSLAVTEAAVLPGRQDIRINATNGDLILQGGVTAVNDIFIEQKNNRDKDGVVTPGTISGSLSRIRAQSARVLSEGDVDIRTEVVTLSGSADGDFGISELDDITIPLLSSKGMVSLEALGVDRGPQGENPIALTARLLDVAALTVNTPNGSAEVVSNTNAPMLVGDPSDILRNGVNADAMTAAGSITIRSEAGDLSLLDAPIAGGNARPVRVATAGELPVSTTYLPGNAGFTPSTLSAVGSINSLNWGSDAEGRLIQLEVGDLVLVKDQIDDSATPTVDERRENGIYRVTAIGGGIYGSSRWQLTRDAASDSIAELPSGSRVRILDGTFAGDIFQVGLDTIPTTLVERVGVNQLQLPELFPNFDLLEVGMVVNGTGIAPDSFISAIDPASRVITLDVIKPGQNFTAGFGTVAVLPVAGEPDTLNVPAPFTSFDELSVGQAVIGEGISPGAVIANIDAAAREIDVAAGLIGTAAATSSGNVLTISPLFTQLTSLRVGQRADVFDNTATRIAGGAITAIDLLSRTVTLDSPIVGSADTARFWSPNGLPPQFGMPVAPGNARSTAVILPADNRLADVRIGQRIQISGTNTSTGVPFTYIGLVTDVNRRVDAAGNVVGDVVVSHNLLIPGGAGSNFASVVASGGTIDFLLPASVEFGVAGPGAIGVTWNEWAVETGGFVATGVANPVVPPAPPQAVLTMLPSTALVNNLGVGQIAEFFDTAGASLTGPTAPFTVNTVTFNPASPPNPANIQATFVDASGAPINVPPGTATVRFSADPRLLTLPTFANFDELTLGLEVTGSTVPAGTVIDQIDPVNRRIRISNVPAPGLTTIAFGVGPTALYPAADVLTLPVAFTNYERIFEGQPVTGPGIGEGSKVVAVDRVNRTVSLTPGSVAPQQTGVAVIRASSSSNTFYPENFDDWVELESGFNAFFDIQVGQRVVFRDAAGSVIGGGSVTAIDARFRTLGLSNGALNGIAPNVSTIDFLAPESIRFGVVNGFGSGRATFSLLPLGLTAVDVTSAEVITNIGSNTPATTVSLVVSTNGRTNADLGSLGKMIGISQANDTSVTTESVGVFGVTQATDSFGNPTGEWVLTLDPLFSGFDRLAQVIPRSLPVTGTPRMFTDAAVVTAVDAAAGTVTLAAGSLSPLAEEDLNRVQVVTLPIATTNPDQDISIAFWQWVDGDFLIEQELPQITNAITINGSLVSAVGNALIAEDFGQIPTRYAGAVIDGRRINFDRRGNRVRVGDEINGLEFFGAGASGSQVANITIGGFTQGAAIKIDSTSHTLVRNVAAGFGRQGERLPSNTSIRVSGTATENTILDSRVVGGERAGIAMEGSSSRTYIVGSSIGTAAINNTVGVFVDRNSSENFIGTDPIVPSPPIATSARLVPGASNFSVSPTIFSGQPLIGLDVTGNGIADGTVVADIDTTAGLVYLSQPVTVATPLVSLVSIGHLAERIDTIARDTLQFSTSVPLDEVFVGQTVQSVTGGIIPANTTITAIDRTLRQVTLSQPFLSAGRGLVTFGLPNRNTVQGNRTGILLRGQDNRVANTDIVDQVVNGVEILGAGQQIGSRFAIGTASTAATPAVGGSRRLAVVTAGTRANLNAAGQNRITLPSNFDRGDLVTPGAEVFGLGIAAGTRVASVVPPPVRFGVWQVVLTAPVLTGGSSTVYFGVNGPAGTLRVDLPEAELAKLHIGQTIHARGMPEFSRVVAIQTRPPAGYPIGYVAISTPEPTGADATPDFSLLAAGAEIVFTERRSLTSNRLSGNSQYAISSGFDDNQPGRPVIVGNYFDMLSEVTESQRNNGRDHFFATYAGPPERHVPTQFDQTDQRGNRYGIGNPDDDPDPPTGGIGPLPPGIPEI
jgi:hypothetical protein